MNPIYVSAVCFNKVKEICVTKVARPKHARFTEGYGSVWEFFFFLQIISHVQHLPAIIQLCESCLCIVLYCFNEVKIAK